MEKENKGQITGLLTITIVMIVVGWYALQIPGRQAEQGKQVEHTLKVLNSLEALSLHVSRMAGERDRFRAYGKSEFLAACKREQERASDELDRVAILTTGNGAQRMHLRGLRRLLNDNGAVEEPAAVDTVREIRQQEAIQAQSDLMQKEERRLLRHRSGKWEGAVGYAERVVLLGVGLLYALMATLCLFLRRAAAAQRAEAERLARIVAIQRDVARHRLDLAAAMQAIAERTQEVTGADGGVVELLETDEMVYRAASGSAKPSLGVRINAASLSGRCVREDVALQCDDAHIDERVDREVCRRVGLRSMVVVPLRHDGLPVGVLKVLSARPRAFSAKDVATLELMAGVLSATLHDALAAAAIRTDNVRLERLASTDALTGLQNRRSFEARLADEYVRARRDGGPLSLILLDVDHFKAYNDTFGHPAGDVVLARVAELLHLTARAADCVARCGGEEFALLLPDTDSRGAEALAERVRERVAGALWEHRLVTVSIGVASLTSATWNTAELVGSADAALYRSKAAGRNRVTPAVALQAA